jgi:predicted Rossmann fold nucleotide-binding protein DprA/Smf involved in DNA uptake
MTKDVVAEATTPADAPVTELGLSEQQRSILLGIDLEPTSVDTIAERTSLPVHLILQELTFLSLKGAVKRVDGQTFARKSQA